MAAGEMATSPPGGTSSSMDPLAMLRSFQRDVLELAHEQNVVMVGSTGIGKTFVAIALLAEQDYASGKRAVFMAPTRQLVLQITAKIQQLSTLVCCAYYGREVELWDEPHWRRELRTTRVLVCTPEVARNVIQRGYLPMDRINLLVFDECHHVTKRHPYAQLMKLYDKDAPHATMPRIFGATACPTLGCADALHATLSRVELDAAQLAQFAAAAPVVYYEYERQQQEEEEREREATTADDRRSEPNDLETALRDGMSDADARVCAQLYLELSTELKVLPVLDKLLRKSQRRAVAPRDHHSVKAGRPKAIHKFIRSCVTVYTQLGAWCYYRLLELEIERLAIASSLLLAVPGSLFGLDRDAVATLLLVQAKRSRCAFAATSKVLAIETLVRSQLLATAEKEMMNASASASESEEDSEEEEEERTTEAAASLLLAAISTTSDDEEEENDRVKAAAKQSQSQSDQLLQGIVFVHTRIECRVLTEYLNDKLACSDTSDSNSEEDEEEEGAKEQTRHLFGCMLGQGSATDTAAFNLPTFQTTLAAFEASKVRVLVSTAVSTEGVDFPLCSLVIVADRVATPRQFIQVCGRARHEDGVVYYLGQTGDTDDKQAFTQLQTAAQAIGSLDFTGDKTPSLLALPRSIAADRLLGHPLTPDETSFVVPATNATIDLDSSVQLINQFCQSLPPSLFSVDCKRMYCYKESVHGSKTPIFQCLLTLPPELEVETVASSFMLSKAMAKASVALQAGRLLYEKGLLDESFNSVYRRKGKAKGLGSQTTTQQQLDFFLDRIHSHE